jgi:hypothetical protein
MLHPHDLLFFFLQLNYSVSHYFYEENKWIVRTLKFIQVVRLQNLT